MVVKVEAKTHITVYISGAEAEQVLASMELTSQRTWNDHHTESSEITVLLKGT